MMEEAGRRTRIDLNNLDGVEDLVSLRAALRAALEQVRSDAARLREWERRAEELEGSRKGFVSLMSQLSESRRLVAEAREEALRMKHLRELAENRARLFEMEKQACAARLADWERKAGDLEEERKKNLSIVAQIPGGADAKEALVRMLEAKSGAENKARFLELEKEACASRLREWENRAADFESLQMNLEERESLSRAAKKSLLEKEAALEKRAQELESEYARRRKELDEYKERLRAEINELKPRGCRPGGEKDATL